jgi:hypothetical protein
MFSISASTSSRSQHITTTTTTTLPTSASPKFKQTKSETADLNPPTLIPPIHQPRTSLFDTASNNQEIIHRTTPHPIVGDHTGPSCLSLSPAHTPEKERKKIPWTFTPSPPVNPTYIQSQTERISTPFACLYTTSHIPTRSRKPLSLFPSSPASQHRISSLVPLLIRAYRRGTAARMQCNAGGREARGARSEHVFGV